MDSVHQHPIKADSRLASLQQWLKTIITDGHTIAPISGDASFRRYFRVYHGEKTWVAMDAPPEHEDCTQVMTIAEQLHTHGLHVPVVMHSDITQGFLLLSDLGDALYLQHLSPTNAKSLYGDAIDALLCMQQIQMANILPDYDRALLLREMCLFSDWFLSQHLNITLTTDMQNILNDSFACLIENALEQPQVFVHRDYHSRNLMLSDTHNPGILDFQDAVLGPITYDVVSLLKDCYIAWPESSVTQWLEHYRHQLKKRHQLSIDKPQLQRWFDLMGMQRHLKAIGIFARLNHRDHKPNYLADIPRTFSYVLNTSQRYRQLADFHRLMQALNIAQRLTP